MDQQQNQVNISIHQQKLIALIGAAVAFIALLLPWTTLGGFMLKNGFEGWGVLALLGVVVIVIISFLGDKTKPYDETFRKIAMGGFGAIVLGALITIIAKDEYVKAGFGVWLSIIAGGAGLAWVAGIIKFPPKAPPPSN